MKLLAKESNALPVLCTLCSLAACPSVPEVLCSAAAEGDVKMVKLLLRAGALPDRHTKDGRQPLHAAAATGNMQVHVRGAHGECVGMETGTA